MLKPKPKIIVILGPTATGKSNLAVRMAKAVKGEIVSADSRQVYRGLTIGSGKITKREMRGIPHHLLDVASPKTTYTAQKYVHDAQKIITDVLHRKHIPIVVGGTGLYIDALVDGVIFPEVPPNFLLRKKFEKKSPAQLFVLLKKKDPQRARTIDKQNKHRLIRALEIVDVLGKVPLQKKKSAFTALHIGLNLPPEKLKTKIHKRLLARMKGGMVAEVMKLRKAGLSWKRFAELGLEYKYVALFLQKKLSKQEILEKLETEIVRYAKRQMTWFKRDKRIKWFRPVKDARNIEDIVKQFLVS